MAKLVDALDLGSRVERHLRVRFPPRIHIINFLNSRLWQYLVKQQLTSSELSLKANNILGVFRKTIDGLNEVISQAKNQAEVKHQEAEAALAEEESLMNVAEQNQAILTKLTELLK